MYIFRPLGLLPNDVTCDSVPGVTLAGAAWICCAAEGHSKLLINSNNTPNRLATLDFRRIIIPPQLNDIPPFPSKL